MQNQIEYRHNWPSVAFPGIGFSYGFDSERISHIHFPRVSCACRWTIWICIFNPAWLKKSVWKRGVEVRRKMHSFIFFFFLKKSNNARRKSVFTNIRISGKGRNFRFNNILFEWRLYSKYWFKLYSNSKFEYFRKKTKWFNIR